MRRAPVLLVVGMLAGASTASFGERIDARLGTAHEALFSIAMDGDKGVAVGAAGDLHETTDSGAHWKPVGAPTPQALLGVALEGAHAIAVGQKGTVVVRDAAAAWKPVDSGTEARLLGVGVNTDGCAFAVGAFGALLKSVDGGLHWQVLTPQWADYVEGGAEPHLYAVDVARDGTVTVVGEFGLILRSSDGGASWQQLHRGEASLFALHLGVDGTGYAVGQDGLALATSDHGASWSAIDVGDKANLLGVASLRNGTVYATGMHEVLASVDAGRSWHVLDDQALPALWYAGIASAGGSVIAVGQAGAIVRISP